jgi:hypothetical protein
MKSNGVTAQLGGLNLALPALAAVGATAIKPGRFNVLATPARRWRSP